MLINCRQKQLKAAKSAQQSQINLLLGLHHANLSLILKNLQGLLSPLQARLLTKQWLVYNSINNKKSSKQSPPQNANTMPMQYRKSQQQSTQTSINPTFPIQRSLRQVHFPIRMSPQIGPMERPPEVVTPIVQLRPDLPILCVGGQVHSSIGVCPQVSPMIRFPEKAVAVDVDWLPFLPSVIVGGQIDLTARISSEPRIVERLQSSHTFLCPDLCHLFGRDGDKPSALQLQIHSSANLQRFSLGETDRTFIPVILTGRPEKSENWHTLVNGDCLCCLLRQSVSYWLGLAFTAEETVKALEFSELPLIFGKLQAAHAAGHSVCLATCLHTHNTYNPIITFQHSFGFLILNYASCSRLPEEAQRVLFESILLRWGFYVTD